MPCELCTASIHFLVWNTKNRNLNNFLVFEQSNVTKETKNQLNQEWTNWCWWEKWNKIVISYEWGLKKTQTNTKTKMAKYLTMTNHKAMIMIQEK